VAAAAANGFDIDTIVMEDGATAHVGVAFVDCDVDVGAAAVQLGRSDTGLSWF
jgi:hypothetical protein